MRQPFSAEAAGSEAHMLRFEKMTVKAQEAVQSGQEIAASHENQQIEPIHLLAALVAQADGVVPPLLSRLGIRSEALTQEIEREIGRLPKVQGFAQQHMGRPLNEMLERSFKEAEGFKDEYVSTEHLFLAIAANRCSVDTYTSLKPSASLNERSSISFRGRPMCCCAKPCTFGKRPISRSISCVNASLRIPSLDSSGGTTPSAWATSAASKWIGSICWFSWLAAISCPLCTASWAFTVIFSNRNIWASLPAASAEKGWRIGPALLSYHSSSAGLLPCGSGHRLGVHIDFDLLWLGFFALRDRQSQHPVLVIGLNRIQIHGIRQREAPGERAIRALHAQVVVVVHLLLELAFTANRQDVVLHADVQILGIDFRQIGLHHEFMLGLVDIHGRSPGSEAGFLAFPVEDIIKETIELVLQGVDPAEGFPSSNGSHL